MITRVRYYVGNVGHPRAAEYGLRTLLEMVISPQCIVQSTLKDQPQDDEVLVTYGTGPEGVDSGVRIFVSGFFDTCYVAQAGIQTQVYYPEPLHRQPCFVDKQELPEEALNVDAVVLSVLSLPMSHSLPLSATDAVGDILRSCSSGSSH